MNTENCVALEKGLVNLERHVHNVTKNYGLPCVVSINKFNFDTQAEIDIVTNKMRSLGVSVVLAEHWAKGGAGAENLAHEVVKLAELDQKPSMLYEDSDSFMVKLEKVATKIYGASEVTATKKVIDQLKSWEDSGFRQWRACRRSSAVRHRRSRPAPACPAGPGPSRGRSTRPRPWRRRAGTRLAHRRR